MRYAKRVEWIAGKGSRAWEINGRAVAMAQAGRDVTFLTVGDPDFDTPAPIREAAKAALDAGRTHYGDIAGLEALRAAIAGKWSQGAASPIAPDQVNIHSGAQNALYSVMQCLVGNGDEVVVPQPTYVTYEAAVGSTGATMVSVPARSENAFHLDIDAVEAAVTERTRAILVNSPNNPTGAIYGREEIEGLVDLCRRRDLWLVSDEVYRAMTYGVETYSPLRVSGGEDRVVALGSLSKSHAMPGWRLGWSVAPKELAGHVTRLGLCMIYGAPTFIQDAALVALTRETPEEQAMRDAYRRRRALVLERLGRSNAVRPIPPEGGMFVFVDVRGAGQSGVDFAFGLLEREGVAVMPGEGFGDAANGHVRISLACGEERLAAACDAIVRHAGAVAGRAA